MTRKQLNLAMIRERGLRIEPFGNNGALSVRGPGIYILVDRIESIIPTDLEPADRKARHGDQ